MDTLSDVLALLKSHRSTFAGLKAGGTWAIDFARRMASSSTRWWRVVAGWKWKGWQYRYACMREIVSC